eukprot:PhF_6_TR7876/c0_g1_i1/m.11540
MCLHVIRGGDGYIFVNKTYMPAMFKHFPLDNRRAISVLIDVLNVQADGCPYFLPWDIIEELFEYIKGVSFIRYLNGNEIDIPHDDLVGQVNFLRDVDKSMPFALCLKSSNVMTTRFGFLCKCEALTSLDMSGLTCLRSIGDAAVAECASLTSVDTSSLTSLETIGYGFLARCSSLTVVDASGLTAV